MSDHKIITAGDLTPALIEGAMISAGEGGDHDMVLDCRAWLDGKRDAPRESRLVECIQEAADMGCPYRPYGG
jgi:hypothetical protein